MNTPSDTSLATPRIIHVPPTSAAGTQLYVVGPEDDEAELKDAVMADMAVSGAACVPAYCETNKR